MADPFADLLHRHAGLIQRVAFGFCRDPHTRDDLLQEIALQLWRAWPRYDRQFAESTFVQRIACNVAISAERRRQRQRVVVPPVPLAAQDVAAPAAEPAVDTAPLLACIDALPALDKALVLLQLEGLPHAEIAAITGLSTSNVGTKLHRLKHTLRRCLGRAGVDLTEES
jgi:RNA polymerase sigma-70 factor, ECF subfamily